MIELDEIREGILDDPARFKVLVCGRRWGKTHLAIAWLFDEEINPGTTLWYVAPTYRQAKLIVWKVVKEALRTWTGPISFNETELTVDFGHNITLSVKGADNEDSLRGVGVHRMVLDEFAFMKPNVWGEVLRPMLSDTRGSAFFIGTPSGYNHFYDVYLKGQGNNPEWKSWQFRSIDHGYIDSDEIEQARNDLDPKTFRQEFEATFETEANRVYSHFERNRHVIKRDDIAKLLSDGIPVHVGMDFNVEHMSAEIGFILGETIHIFDEIRLKNSNTFEMASVLKKKYPNAYVYPDPAGSARKTSATKSDHQILREAGFHIFAPRKHTPVKDRVNAVQAMLLNANGQIRLTMESCPYLVGDLERITYKNGEPNKSNQELTHAADALGYMVDYHHSITRGNLTNLKRE